MIGIGVEIDFATVRTKVTVAIAVAILAVGFALAGFASTIIHIKDRAIVRTRAAVIGIRVEIDFASVGAEIGIAIVVARFARAFALTGFAGQTFDIRIRACFVTSAAMQNIRIDVDAGVSAFYFAGFTVPVRSARVRRIVSGAG